MNFYDRLLFSCLLIGEQSNLRTGAFFIPLTAYFSPV